MTKSNEASTMICVVLILSKEGYQQAYVDEEMFKFDTM